MPSLGSRARVAFIAHAVATAALAILNTGGGCGPGGGDPLPSVAAACGDGGAPGALDAGVTGAAVRVGTTDPSGAFREIAPGEALPVVHGLQGGSHVWGAARLLAPRAGTWVLRFTLQDAAGKQLAGTAQPVDACPGGVAVVTYVTVFLDSLPPLSGVLSVEAQPLDDAGAPAHDEVAVRVQ